VVLHWRRSLALAANRTIADKLARELQASHKSRLPMLWAPSRPIGAGQQRRRRSAAFGQRRGCAHKGRRKRELRWAEGAAAATFGRRHTELALV